MFTIFFNSLFMIILCVKMSKKLHKPLRIYSKIKYLTFCFNLMVKIPSLNQPFFYAFYLLKMSSNSSVFIEKWNIFSIKVIICSSLIIIIIQILFSKLISIITVAQLIMSASRLILSHEARLGCRGGSRCNHCQKPYINFLSKGRSQIIIRGFEPALFQLRSRCLTTMVWFVQIEWKGGDFKFIFKHLLLMFLGGGEGELFFALNGGRGGRHSELGRSSPLTSRPRPKSGI